MRSIDVTAKSVDEAIFMGIDQLGLSIDQVDIEIIEEGGRRLFGIGSKQCVVRLTERAPEEVERVLEEQEKQAEQEKQQKQETEEGYRTVEASAPCVVTVTNQNMTHVTQRSRIKWQQERNQSAILKKLILLILKKKKSENLMQRFRSLNYMNQRRKKPESRFRKKHQKIQQ